MSKVLVSENNLSSIADSIRAKNGTQETYKPSEMSTAIDNLPSGGDTSEYFTETINPMSGYSGVAKMVKKLPPETTFSGTDMRYAFYGCFNLESLPMLDTSNVTRFDWAFRQCEKVASIPLYDMSKNTSLEYTFYGCSSIETLPLFNTQNVTSWYGTFMNCTKLKALPLFNTSKADNMYNLCSNCQALENVPLLDTAKVSNLTYSFSGCPRLTSESLNNILKMCANSRVTSNKTLYRVGLTSAQATICEGLSNYQEFIDAGWTTGY